MTKYLPHSPRGPRHFGVAILICLAGNALLLAGPVGSPEVASNMKDSATRLERIDQGLASISQAIIRVEAQLRTLLGVVDALKAQETSENIQQLRAERERLNGRIADLQKWVAEQKDLLRRIREDNKSEDSVESSDRQVKEARAELDELRAKVAARKTNGSPSFNRLPASMEPVTFVLSGGRVAPLGDAYFKGARVIHDGKLQATIEATREGQPVEEAVGAGGCLATGIAGIDAQKKFVAIVVCPDSVAAFDAVVKKVKQEGFRCVWEPAPALPWLVPLDNENSGTSGGSIGF